MLAWWYSIRFDQWYKVDLAFFFFSFLSMRTSKEKVWRCKTRLRNPLSSHPNPFFFSDSHASRLLLMHLFPLPVRPVYVTSKHKLGLQCVLWSVYLLWVCVMCVWVLPITPAINTRSPSVTEFLGGCSAAIIGCRWSPRSFPCMPCWLCAAAPSQRTRARGRRCWAEHEVEGEKRGGRKKKKKKSDRRNKQADTKRCFCPQILPESARRAERLIFWTWYALSVFANHSFLLDVIDHNQMRFPDMLDSWVINGGVVICREAINNLSNWGIGVEKCSCGFFWWKNH